MSVSINIDYLTNITAIQAGDKVTLGFNADKAKALSAKDISADGIETNYAIMPVVAEAKKEKSTKKTKEKPQDTKETV